MGEETLEGVPMGIYKHIEEVTWKSTGREVLGTKIQVIDRCNTGGDE